MKCSQARDCLSGSCSGGLCVLPAFCSNSVKDGNEGGE